MLGFAIKVKIKGIGLCCHLKKNANIPQIEWSVYSTGGARYNPGTYCKTPPDVPHFLWWYYKKYRVEFICIGCMKRIDKMVNLVKPNSGDIIVMPDNRRYLCVKNDDTDEVKTYFFQTNKKTNNHGTI